MFRKSGKLIAISVRSILANRLVMLINRIAFISKLLIVSHWILQFMLINPCLQQ